MLQLFSYKQCLLDKHENNYKSVVLDLLACAIMVQFLPRLHSGFRVDVHNSKAMAPNSIQGSPCWSWPFIVSMLKTELDGRQTSKLLTPWESSPLASLITEKI